MSLIFLNLAMLGGFLAVGVPVLVHLLSRRNYDVVYWGAMRFLAPDPQTRRSVMLDDVWLLLVRMILVGLLALCLARPTVLGVNWLGTPRTEPRDVAIIIDASGSQSRRMGAEDGLARSVALAKRVLESLQPGDSAALIVARHRPITDRLGLTAQLDRLKQSLEELDDAAGPVDLPAALLEGLRVLAASRQANRDVVLVTDGQAEGWKLADAARWLQLDDMLTQAKIRPRLFVLSPETDRAGISANRALGPIELSRESASPGLPVRISVPLARFDPQPEAGGAGPGHVEVRLFVDGQATAGQSQTVAVPRAGTIAVTFEHRFDAVGPHSIRAAIDPDDTPVDDEAWAAVEVTSAVPALLVDGATNADPARSETFFAQTALTPRDNAMPWIRARMIPVANLTAESLREPHAVVLANVESLSPEQAAAIVRFVNDGGGLLVTLGDHGPADDRTLADAGLGDILAAKWSGVRRDEHPELGGVRVSSESLNAPWLRRFRPGKTSDLVDAQFTMWRRLVTTGDAGSTAAASIKLTTGDPLLMTRRAGLGQTAVFASSLDADWNTLPNKHDYVVFLHELLLTLAHASERRNVGTGESIVVRRPENIPADTEIVWKNANDDVVGASPSQPDEGTRRQQIALPEAPRPGVYRAVNQQGNDAVLTLAAAHGDLRESDPTPLSLAEMNRLSEGGRLTWIVNVDGIVRTLKQSPNARTELWNFLLWAFIGLMAVESALIARRYSASTNNG